MGRLANEASHDLEIQNSRVALPVGEHQRERLSHRPGDAPPDAEAQERRRLGREHVLEVPTVEPVLGRSKPSKGPRTARSGSWCLRGAGSPRRRGTAPGPPSRMIVPAFSVRRGSAPPGGCTPTADGASHHRVGLAPPPGPVQPAQQSGTRPAPSSITPPRGWGRSNTPSRGQAQRKFCGRRTGEEVLGPQVLAAAQPVLGPGMAVVVMAAAGSWPRAHVQQKGTPASLIRRQTGSRSGWPGDISPAGAAGTQMARPPAAMAASTSIRAWAGSSSGTTPTAISRLSPAQNSAMARLSRRAAVLHRQVRGRQELRRRRCERELAREAQVVQRAGALVGVHGAVGRPALGAGDDVEAIASVAATSCCRACAMRDGLGRARAAGLQPHADQPVADRGVGVGREPVQALHDVAVGVVNARPAAYGIFRTSDVL